MSGSEEKTPTVSPDQGATGETTTSSENKEGGMQTGLSEEEMEAHFEEEYMKNIHRRNPELGWDIIIRALFKDLQGRIGPRGQRRKSFRNLTT